MTRKKTPAYLESFRRITSAGNYIPEIDGLRFISITWVVVCLHTANLLNQKIYNGQLVKNEYWQSVFTEGGYGVSLFMIISGFILSLPFIRQYRLGGPGVSLKKYYLRRLTRLEPPYLIALLILFIILVFILGKYSFNQLLPHLGASAIYMHNIIYHQQSFVMGVAWSLEIEVQFYILAPLLCMIFLVKNTLLRRLILITLIIVTAVYAYHKFWTLPVILPNFICYFLAGMLLADFYLCTPIKLNSNLFLYTGLSLAFLLPLLISIYSIYGFLLKFLLIILLFACILFNERLKAIMSKPLITIIGGMCYSIYLLHFMILSAVSFAVLEFFPLPSFSLAPVFVILMLASVLVISAVFFKLVEQPFMRFRAGKSIKKVE